MPGTPAPHNAIFAQLAARHLLARDYTPGAVFAGTGFGQALLHQEDPVAPFAVIAGLFERAAALTGDRLFGFRLGCATDLRKAGLLGYIARSSPTAGCFLRNIARYAGVMSDVWEIDTSRLASHGEFTWTCRGASGSRARQYIEFLAAIFFSALRDGTEARIEPQSAAFSHERSSGRDEVQAFYGCPVEFGAQASRFVFRPEDLELPLAGADRVLLRLLRSYGDQILEGQVRGRKNTGLAAQVEDAVSARLSGGSATLANVAADLGMSPRTLSRKLAQTGTSYFTILEELRKALAIRYLRESGLALAEIAFLLGYSGLNSFSDAFRRWTGQSPGQFRGK